MFAPDQIGAQSSEGEDNCYSCREYGQRHIQADWKVKLASEHRNLGEAGQFRSDTEDVLRVLGHRPKESAGYLLGVDSIWR